MKQLLVLILAPMLILAVGCAKPPVEKVAAAEKAVAEARDAGAPQYAAEDLAKLESLLAGARTEIAAQDNKMALLRDYGKAEQILGTIPTESARVVGETQKKKEEAKNAAMQAQQAAQASVKAAEDLIAQAPAGKDRAALEAIKTDVQAVTASLAEVQSGIEKADYQGAEAKAKAIQEKAQALSTELQTAIDKMNAAKAPKGKTGKK